MTQTHNSDTGIPRVSSGVAGLDTILNGGFLQGGIYIIMGLPGNGKTILSNQICFHQVREGGRALYVTLLAESHARLLAHLRPMAFFDTTVIANSLHYISGYQILEVEGLRGLLSLLRQEIRAHKANILVIDGLTTITAVVESDLTLKRFLHELQIFNETAKCTAFLLTQPYADPYNSPSHTIVDGLVELSKHQNGPRTVREIEIHKLRGTAFLEGRHRFTIDNNGITVYPRIETLFDSTIPSLDVPTNRLTFGISRFDEMLHGGILEGSTTMLLGVPGSGKTILGLHFLSSGVHQGESSLYFGCYERPGRLLNKAQLLGFDMKEAFESGLLQVIWQSPLETVPDELAERLLKNIRKHQIKRLFLDGLDGFQEAEIYPERMSRFFAALTDELRTLGVTTLFSVELRDLFSPNILVPIGGISALADNIVLLRYVELNSQLHRLISLMKMRESSYETDIRGFHITNQGIEVASKFTSAEAILTGIAHPITPAAPADE